MMPSRLLPGDWELVELLSVVLTVTASLADQIHILSSEQLHELTGFNSVVLTQALFPWHELTVLHTL